MSEAYATDDRLVNADSSGYDRALDGTIALGIVGFALGLLTLVELVALDSRGAALSETLATLLVVVAGGLGVVGLSSWANVTPVDSQRVRGVAGGLLVALLGLTVAAYAVPANLATLLGGLLLLEAVAIAAAGVVSNTGLVDTEPDASAGLLAGVAFGVFGLVLGAVLGGTLLGSGGFRWAGAGLLAGAALFALTVVPREDLGSTLPAAAVVGTLGATIATATIGVGWRWTPSAVSGGFTGGAVIPVFLLVGTLVAAWAAAKCRAGFGARGREYGAFLVINLNAVLMVAIMATIVVFVTSKGVGFAFHGATVGALSALVLLSPLLVLAVETARTPTGAEAWHRGARQLFRLLPLAVVGAVAALLASVLARGRSLDYAYTYTVLQNRTSVVLDTSVAITPETTVGSLVLLFPALLLAAYFFRQYGSLRDVGSQFDRVEAVRRRLPLAVAGVLVLTGALVLVGGAPVGLPLGLVAGLAVVGAGSVATVGLAVLPLVGLLVGSDPSPSGPSTEPRCSRSRSSAGSRCSRRSWCSRGPRGSPPPSSGAGSSRLRRCSGPSSPPSPPACSPSPGAARTRR